jgi:hypothetical protein
MPADRTSIVGFDSAWVDNPYAPGAVCAIRIPGYAPPLFGEPERASFGQALTFIERERADSDLCLVALDQPTIVPNMTSSRPVDRIAGSLDLLRQAISSPCAARQRHRNIAPSLFCHGPPKRAPTGHDPSQPPGWRRRTGRLPTRTSTRRTRRARSSVWRASVSPRASEVLAGEGERCLPELLPRAR